MFKPSKGKILILPLEEKDKSDGGILIPVAAKERPMRGEVIALGESTEATHCKEGDIVLYSKWAGTECTLDGKKYIISKEEDILGVIEE